MRAFVRRCTLSLSCRFPRRNDRLFFSSSSSSFVIEDDSAALRMLTVDSSKLEAEYAEFRERVQVAETHLEHGRFGEAVTEYEAVARSFPANYYFGELHLGLGCAFVGLNQPALAIASFDRALSFDPSNVHAFLNKGLAQTSQGDKKAALETFKAAIPMAEKAKEETFVAQFRIYSGQLMEELSDDDGALAMYQAIIKDGPDYSQAWYLAGCIFAKQEKRELALKYFREAIDCSRPWPSAYYKLSRLVADPLEKRALYDNFVSAQRKMAEEEEGTNQIDQSPLSRVIQKQ